MWAAEGLAHACWISYADSNTRLGPESMAFHGESLKKAKRWVDVVKEWEEGGRVGKAPPGVRDAVPVDKSKGEETEYVVVDSKYMLRPEVGSAEPHVSDRPRC